MAVRLFTRPPAFDPIAAMKSEGGDPGVLLEYGDGSQIVFCLGACKSPASHPWDNFFFSSTSSLQSAFRSFLFFNVSQNQSILEKRWCPASSDWRSSLDDMAAGNTGEELLSCPVGEARD